MSGNRRSVWSWCLYDFANSPFTTLMVTFVFSAYFTQQIARDNGELWSRGITITAIVVALASPFMGALADRGGFRKLFLLICTFLCIPATAGLFWIDENAVLLALFLFVAANIVFELGMVFYNAFLPDITSTDNVGRISGNGWALGYLGGLIALVLALVLFIQPEQPLFGLDKENNQHIRGTALMVALWFAVFSVPIFAFVKEDKSRVTRDGAILAATVRQFAQTFKEIRRYRQIVRFLLARLVFNDALITVFAFGAIYATGTFGFTMQENLIFGIVLNVMAGSGAFAMGYLDDKLGGKRTLQISLYGLILATILAVFAPNKTVFWIGGILVGIFSGPNQSASRSLMARFVPDDKENEFFGFFAFSGKATAFLGPFLFGWFTGMFGSQRYGIAVVLALFVLGLILLARVDEAEGTQAAQRKRHDQELTT